MSLLDDIRQQPRRTREIMFGLCVVTSVSLIGLVWFRSFQTNVFVLMNPDEEAQRQFFAARDQGTSLFGYAAKAYKETRAAISSLANREDKKQEIIIEQKKEPAPVHPLPVSGER